MAAMLQHSVFSHANFISNTDSWSVRRGRSWPGSVQICGAGSWSLLTSRHGRDLGGDISVNTLSLTLISSGRERNS